MSETIRERCVRLVANDVIEEQKGRNGHVISFMFAKHSAEDRINRMTNCELLELMDRRDEPA